MDEEGEEGGGGEEGRVEVIEMRDDVWESRLSESQERGRK